MRGPTTGDPVPRGTKRRRASRDGRLRPPRPSSLLAACALVAVALAAGCGSSGSKTTTTNAPAAATSPQTTTTPATTTAAASGLSGTWSGQYSGAYSGTFVLKWTQSGSALTGTITLSAPPGTLNVNGTLQGSAIKFGTVGSAAITYTGTASSSSMSGSYQTARGGGSWSANKTS